MIFPTFPELFGEKLPFDDSLTQRGTTGIWLGNIVVQEEPARRIQVNSLMPAANIFTSGAGITVSACRPKQEYFNLHNFGKCPRQFFYPMAPAPAAEKGAYTEVPGTEAVSSSVTDVITPAAEKFARSLGIYGTLVIVRELVREKMQDVMTALHIDRKDDPDEQDASGICLTIFTKSSVDTMLDRDDDLQLAVVNRVSARASVHFSFAYQFES